MCSGERDAERAGEKRRAVQERSQQLSTAGTGRAQRMVQEQCPKKIADEITPVQTQCETNSHETQDALGRVPAVADRGEASKASHSEKMRQVGYVKTEHERERGRDRECYRRRIWLSEFVFESSQYLEVGEMLVPCQQCSAMR